MVILRCFKTMINLSYNRKFYSDCFAHKHVLNLEDAKTLMKLQNRLIPDSNSGMLGRRLRDVSLSLFVLG